MKLLIMCDMFPPAFAPRMGYVCKYMQKAGWQPVVITEQINENMFAFLDSITDVTYISYYSATGRISKRLEWLWVMLLDFFFAYKDRKMYAAACKKAGEGGFAGVLCSTYRTFPLPAAQRIAKRFHLPFVADLRDIIEQFAGNEYISHTIQVHSLLDKWIIAAFRRKLLNGRNKVIRTADFLTTVSPWHVTMLQSYNPNVQLIYNGYDPELFYPDTIPTPTFRLTFTGRMVSLATRDPRLLFEAIRILADEGTIRPETFRVEWYMDEASRMLIEPMVAQYGIENYMDYCGYVAADKIPGILNRSSVLLQLANRMDNNGPKGIMSTKLFEAFAVQKPLLCVRSDESYLEETIRKARAGVSARTVDDILPFLRHQYAEWEKNGYTTIDVDMEVVESFSRWKQADQFMQLFTELNDKGAYHG